MWRNREGEQESHEHRASQGAQNGAAYRALRRRHTTIRTQDVSEGDIESDVVPPVNYRSFVYGLAAGVAQAGLFNPMDRALYLSVKNDIPFLRAANFQNPYQGFVQSVGHRAISGGLFYPLEQFFMTFIPKDEGRKGPLYNLLVGTAAGSVNALLTNPIAAIKYKTWGREENRGLTHEAMEMMRKGGIRPFLNGMTPTILRDLVFGGCYTFLRFEFQYYFDVQPDHQWAPNFCAAAIATVLSGPFNLARNIQYATKSRHVAFTVGEVLTNLRMEIREKPNIIEKLIHLQNRTRVGWGTARVAIGMAFGHSVYDWLAGIYG